MAILMRKCVMDFKIALWRSLPKIRHSFHGVWNKIEKVLFFGERIEVV